MKHLLDLAIKYLMYLASTTQTNKQTNIRLDNKQAPMMGPSYKDKPSRWPCYLKKPTMRNKGSNLIVKLSKTWWSNEERTPIHVGASRKSYIIFILSIFSTLHQRNRLLTYIVCFLFHLVVAGKTKILNFCVLLMLVEKDSFPIANHWELVVYTNY